MDAAAAEKKTVFNTVSSHQIEKAWLITFADLITLLLCFFIAVFVSARSKVKDFGTVLAEPILEEKPESIWLTEEDFFGSSSGLAEAAKLKIENLINSVGYGVKEVAIKACFGNEEVNSSAVWFIVMSRLSAIERQIIDLNIDQQKLSFDALGSSCKKLAAKSEDRAVAQVSLIKG